ncbi:MAG: citrate/2-methylcitrate synthase [Leptospiraceae bacterium]|nr:citrate/2-methylcitrate synthase [Leptospiraceae bacterium]
MNKKAELIIEGKRFEFPIVEGVDGNSGIDISNLQSSTGLVAVDPGFFNTAIGESKVSRREPDTGKLFYRGYSVSDLADHSTFMETSYLLIYGNLPSKEELTDFSRRLSKHSMIHEDMTYLFDGFPGKAHPLALLSTMVMALSSYYPDHYEESIDKGIDQASRLLAKVRTIAAQCYKRRIGQPIVHPLDKLPYCTNFLYMMFSVPATEYTVDPYLDKVLNQLWILYADHEQNVAATTVQMVGSTKANLFASISAGISALWGSREGGQSVAAVEMIEEVIQSGISPKDYIEKLKSSGKLSSSTIFGHSAYTTVTERALVARKIFNEFSRKFNNKLLDTAKVFEEIVLQDAYFKENNLFPNLEFYSGFIFNTMGIPKEMFTLMQAIGKLPGWMAHWREQRINPNSKKVRPRQIYKGEMGRTYITIEKR